MNWPEAVVLIVVVSGFAKVLRARYYADSGFLRGPKGRLMPIDPQPDDGPPVEADALRREIADLRERIKVLERIATDDSRPRALADEIEALRGK